MIRSINPHVAIDLSNKIREDASNGVMPKPEHLQSAVWMLLFSSLALQRILDVCDLSELNDEGIIPTALIRDLISINVPDGMIEFTDGDEESDEL